MGRGEPMPEGALIDSGGAPTTDPSVMFPGSKPGAPEEHGQALGALLPAGEHKGGGLALACELLGAVLSGGRTITGEKGGGVILNSMTTVIVDVAATAGAGGGMNFLRAEAEAVFDFVKASPPRPGGQLPFVLLPGEGERIVEAAREQEGIPLSAGTWQDLMDVGATLGLDEDEMNAHIDDR